MSASPVFSGVVPPVATPLLPDGDIDTVSLRRLVDHLIAGGVDGLFVLGSTGETAYITDAQRVDVVRTVVDAAAGRVPVIAGAIELTAARVIETATRLVAGGAQAIVTTAPLYTLNSQAEIAAHFRRIAAAIDVPLWAYDVPVRVHTKIALSTLMDLAADGTIAGVKDSSGDDVGFRRLVAANAAAGHPLQLLTGHEVVVDAIGLVGADGVVPGLGNVDVEGYVRLWKAVEAGDFAVARAEQERINRLFEIVFQVEGLSGDATGVGAFKEAMFQRGLIDHATMATGVTSIGSEARQRIRAILSALELLP